jgi:thioredoxin 2
MNTTNTTTMDDRGIIVPCRACGQRNRVPFERLADAGRCGNCKADLSALSAPLDVSSAAHFDRIIAASALPVVVDYWAPWCGPCRMVAPELEKVATAGAGRFLVVKVNTEALPDLAQRHQIRSIPTLAVFASGREVARDAGARPAPAIEAFVRQALGAASGPRWAG